MGQVAPGNVVAPSPKLISLPVSITGPADGLSWELYNGWNILVAQEKSGPIPEGGKMAIKVTLNSPGLYVLKTHLLNGDKVIAEATTNLAALEPYDLSKVADSPFAVDMHYGQGWDPDSLPVLAAMGAKFMRDSCDWSQVELQKGVMKIPDNYQRVANLAASLHINLMQMLGFGNQFHYPDPGIPAYEAAPYTQEGYDAYARYCTYMVGHFRNQSQFFEIWNEYNGAFAQGPAGGRPEIYAAMARTAYPAIKRANPKAFVVGPSTAGLPMDWIEQTFQHGALDNLDGVSMHPYGYTSIPEAMEPSLVELRALIRKYNHGREKPIWATEEGWYLIKSGEQGNREPITEFVQAEYLVRAWTVMLGQNVQRIFWYVGRDFGPFPNMGLMTSDTDPRGKYAPKPDYVAYATLIRQLTGYSSPRRAESPPNVYDYVFTQGDYDRHVLWATRPQDVGLRSMVPVTVTDMFGATTTLHPVNDTLNLHLTQAPIYISGKLGFAPMPLFHMQIPTTLARNQSFSIKISMTPDAQKSLLPALDFYYGAEVKQLETKTEGDAASATFQLSARPSVDGEAWTPFELYSGKNVVLVGSHHALLYDPVTADRFPRLKSLDVLQESVTNVSQESPATVQKIDYAINGQTRTLSSSQALAPGSTFDFQLPVTNLQPFTIYPVTITVTLGDGTQISVKNDVSYNPVMRRTIKVDGSLDDWDLSHGIDIDNAPYIKLAEQRRDAKDLGGKIYLAADDHDLYMAAIIEDDVFFQNYTGANVWRGDSLQIGITSLAPWTGGEWPTGQQEFEIALTPKGPEMTESGKPQLSGVKIAIKRKGTQTIYEAALPWTAINGVKGPLSQFSWAVFVNDNDGHGRKGYLQWGDIKALNGMQPFYFNSFNVKP